MKNCYVMVKFQPSRMFIFHENEQQFWQLANFLPLLKLERKLMQTTKRANNEKSLADEEGIIIKKKMAKKQKSD